VFKVGIANWGGHVRVIKVASSRRGLQGGVFKSGVRRSGVVNSWFPVFDGVRLLTTSSDSTRGGDRRDPNVDTF
jgi:hypothetical protein